MEKEKICLIGNEEDANILTEKGYQVTLLPDISKGREHLIKQQNLTNYFMVIVFRNELGVDEVEKFTADCQKKARTIAKPGQRGSIGSYQYYSDLYDKGHDFYAWANVNGEIKSGWNSVRGNSCDSVLEAVENCMSTMEVYGFDEQVENQSENKLSISAQFTRDESKTLTIAERTDAIYLSQKLQDDEKLTDEEKIKLIKYIKKIPMIREEVAREERTEIMKLSGTEKLDMPYIFRSPHIKLPHPKEGN